MVKKWRVTLHGAGVERQWAGDWRETQENWGGKGEEMLWGTSMHKDESTNKSIRQELQGAAGLALLHIHSNIFYTESHMWLNRSVSERIHSRICFLCSNITSGSSLMYAKPPNKIKGRPGEIQVTYIRKISFRTQNLCLFEHLSKSERHHSLT